MNICRDDVPKTTSVEVCVLGKNMLILDFDNLLIDFCS